MGELDQRGARQGPVRYGTAPRVVVSASQTLSIPTHLEVMHVTPPSAVAARLLPDLSAAPVVTDASARARQYLDTHCPPTPCLVVDLDVVSQRYASLRRVLPEAAVYYAVKACPEPAVLRTLAELGSSFDVASRPEIDLCLGAGVSPDRISYGNTIKKATDIEYAYQRGVRMYTFDSEPELRKLAQHAPGASVICRILVSGDGAQWPLSRKFGCESEMAAALLIRAAQLGLDPAGVSFHVGSQQCQPSQWAPALAAAAGVFGVTEAAGVRLRVVNIGGGFPAQYTESTPTLAAYARAVKVAVRRAFPREAPQIICEPGRSIAADAGVLRTEVVLVARKGYDDPDRWVYLDVGRFGGLAETEGEAIRYRIRTTHDPGDPVGPVILAGPTCDSADVLYERTKYELPMALADGDVIDFLSTGAYTATYSSEAFNGFPPLTTYCI